MKIGTRQIGPDQPPYIIAEIGVNHDGSVDRALELVGAAARAGADAIKLQLFEAARLLSRAAKSAAYQRQAGASDPFHMLQRLQLSADQMRPIVAAAHQSKIHAIVTVFSVELIEQAQALDWDAYKTASPDIINRPLIAGLLATGRPLLVSTGASTVHEVEHVTRWLGSHPHVLMQCVSAYPATDEQAALGGRHALQQINPRALGYSDHTTSVDTGALAVASGARVVEKHLTHDRCANGPDHAASLDPEAFADYVRLAHRAFAMVGPHEKRVLAVEREVHLLSRQSLTSTRPLPQGHRLARADLTIKRPGHGISPARLEEVIGRRVQQPIEADMPIEEERLA